MRGKTQNGTRNPDIPFPWTAKSSKTAALVADDFLTDDEIAAEVGIARTTLEVWKRHPDFKARVAELKVKLSDRTERFAIAKRERRVAAQNDRWEKMQRVMAARAEEHKDVPGGDTGMLCRTVKQIGNGPTAREVEEYAVDTGLLKELREHEKQSAQELGQWTEKIAPTDPTGQHEYGKSGGTGALDALFTAIATALTREKGDGSSGDGVPEEIPPAVDTVGGAADGCVPDTGG